MFEKGGGGVGHGAPLVGLGLKLRALMDVHQKQALV